eukprot:g44728.t1
MALADSSRPSNMDSKQQRRSIADGPSQYDLIRMGIDQRLLEHASPFNTIKSDLLPQFHVAHILIASEIQPEELKLDPSTAHPLLIITNGSTRVECGTYLKRLSLVQERFDYNTCILANKGFSSGKHYWQVIVNEKMKWRLGVIKGTTGRKGKLNKTPENGVWMIGVKEGKIYEAYKNPKVQLTLFVRPRKIGIFLDYEGKRLSFYNVDNPDELSLIYTFDADFQGKIYPIFDLCCVDRSDLAPITLCPETNHGLLLVPPNRDQ